MLIPFPIAFLSGAVVVFPVEIIRDYKPQVDQLEACIHEAKTELRELLETRGENWNDGDGYARLISEGERTFYDASALDNLIIEDPLRCGCLKDYRLKSTVQGRLQVK